MERTRRQFLKQASIGGAALTVAGCASTEHHPEHMARHGRQLAAGPMPRGMTFVTLARGSAYTLGVKTPRGILDVAAAAAQMRATCPTTIDDVIRYGDAGLSDVVKSASDGGLWLQEGAVRFGPSVTNPQKIVCVGLNYARHARETNNPIPKLPILFNKFNNALNRHGGTIVLPTATAENTFELEYSSQRR